MREHDLVTFMLLAYNQEAFVREAIGGALAQTYSPLEVILSDDASTDGTFEIIRELAGRYAGPHRVIVNRNPRNLGIGAHVQRLNELASGRFVVFAGGDDISLPNRTEASVAAFLAVGAEDLLSVATEFSAIDSSGRPVDIAFPAWRTSATAEQGARAARLRRFIDTLCPYSPGCAHTCRRELLSTPAPLSSDLVSEDLALSFRAHLLGRIGTVRVPCVLYRIHGANVSQMGTQHVSAAEFVEETERRRWLWHRGMAALYAGFARDLAGGAAQSGLRPDERRALDERVRRRRDLHKAVLSQLDGPFWTRVLAPWHVAALGGSWATVKASILRALPSGMATVVRRISLGFARASETGARRARRRPKPRRPPGD